MTATFPKAILHRTARRAVRGVSLIELLTALTISMMILLGLTTVFVNSSSANRELKNTSEQIESGRYAVEFLAREIRHAGFYGELSTLPAVPATAPDPCAAPTSARIDTSSATTSPLAMPLQYLGTAPVTISGGCAALLTAANLAADSDIIVVRRADTTPLPVTSATSYTFTATTAGKAYLQATPSVFWIQYGAASGTSIDGTKDATGTVIAVADAMRLRPDTSVASAGTPKVFPQIAAAIREYHVQIYFVAPCSAGLGTSGQCTGGAGEDTIPTLKRIEIGAAGALSIVSISEGIQAIRIEFGIDNTPSTADINTGLIGDSVPDSYLHAPTSLIDMGNTVAAKIYVLARNTSPTTGYVDDKTYTLGANPAFTYSPSGAQAAYKRHVYNMETRILNQAGRREIPS